MSRDIFIESHYKTAMEELSDAIGHGLTIILDLAKDEVDLDEYYLKTRAVPYPLKYQLVSRVFNADFIEELDLNHVVVPQKFLVQYPDKPEEFTDESYCVLAEKLMLPEQKENLRRWKNLLEHPEGIAELLQTYKDDVESSKGWETFDEVSGKVRELIKPDHQELFDEVVTVIKEVSLWNMTPDNVFIADEGKVAVVDTEQAGIGGATSNPSFYRKDDDQLRKNAMSGLEILCTLLAKAAQTEV